MHEFERLLSSAIVGNKNDMEKILLLYRPLIDKMSYVEGVLDEDLRQYLMLHIINNIGKFLI